MLNERLAEIGHLKSGAHMSFEAGYCIMEAVSYVAGEPWSDSPKCCCPVIATFLRNWNDALPDDERDMLLPLLPKLIGTRNPALEVRRSLMAADWVVRTHTPAWLRLAGLTDQAETLERLPEITDMAQVPLLRGPLEAVREDADAAWAVAWAAARVAAWAALADTRQELQQSALELVNRMIEVSDVDGAR